MPAIQAPIHSETATVWPITEGGEQIDTVRLGAEYRSEAGNVYRVAGVSTGRERFQVYRIFPVREWERTPYSLPYEALANLTRVS